jgi:hypothetical protein
MWVVLTQKIRRTKGKMTCHEKVEGKRMRNHEVIHQVHGHRCGSLFKTYQEQKGHRLMTSLMMLWSPELSKS